ncbi:DUF222 domain-containing protein [Yimella sp. cx-51]|nr:DUF222 domain-containing protein [Yimella sp. cx-51]QTH39516.1 DUF222 domain-containing protein [Yimella sp. cx-51]
MQQAEAALVAVTSDAIERGAVYRSTAADACQWVQRLSTGEPVAALVGAETASLAGPPVPAATEAESAGVEGDDSQGGGLSAGGMEPAHASRVAKLADACLVPANRVLRDAVTTGAVNTSVAKTALDHTPRVAAVLDGAERDQIFGWYLSLDPGAGSKQVRELTKRIIAEYGEDQLDADEDTQQRYESLSWSELPDGMVRLIADLSQDHAEQVKHAIGALSAPAPASDCCDDVFHRHDVGARPTGTADVRVPGKRRADALLKLITMGAAAVDDDGRVRTFGSARIVVTIDFDALAKAVAGLGVSQGGVGITPETVRQLACDAEIIPMVLGSTSQPLDVGRRKRLVDKELRLAVMQRDRHCTFDGCDRPPVMCEVHHVVSWWAGGVTSLLNSALLCGTHHRIVHRDDLTATVTGERVTWQHAKAAKVA